MPKTTDLFRKEALASLHEFTEAVPVDDPLRARPWLFGGLAGIAVLVTGVALYVLVRI